MIETIYYHIHLLILIVINHMHQEFFHLIIAFSIIVCLSILTLIRYIYTNLNIISTTCNIFRCIIRPKYQLLWLSTNIDNITYTAHSTTHLYNYTCKTTIPCYYYKYDPIISIEIPKCWPFKTIFAIYLGIIIILIALLYSLHCSIQIYKHYHKSTIASEINDISHAIIIDDSDIISSEVDK